MTKDRVTLLDGELALGIYHDVTERVDKDAIKLDFLETAQKDEWRLFKSDRCIIGISLPEARSLLAQLAYAVATCETMRATKRKARKTRTSDDTQRR